MLGRNSARIKAGKEGHRARRSLKLAALLAGWLTYERRPAPWKSLNVAAVLFRRLTRLPTELETTLGSASKETHLDWVAFGSESLIHTPKRENTVGGVRDERLLLSLPGRAFVRTCLARAPNEKKALNLNVNIKFAFSDYCTSTSSALCVLDTVCCCISAQSCSFK